MEFLNTIKDQVIVLDGAMGTVLQNLDLTDEDFGGSDFRMLGDLLSFSHPDKIEQVHFDYYKAGANAVETNTFGASPMRLEEYNFTEIDLERFEGLPKELGIRKAADDKIAYELSKRGAELAVKAMERYKQDSDYDGRPLYVVGSIGPSNRVLSRTEADLKVSTFDDIMENFRVQVSGLMDGGIDVVLFETQQDILELKAAVFGARKAMEDKGQRLPIMAQVTVDQFSRMQIFNTDIHAAMVTLIGTGIDTFGINCSIGPDLMVKTVETICKYSPVPISIIPNAGLPVSEEGRTVYKFQPDDLAGYLKDFVENYGVNIVGGCCGTGPDHITAVANAVKGLKPKERTPQGGIWLSGPQKAIELDSREGLIAVGERLNVRGSQKVREAVEHDGPIDHETLEEIVDEQINGLGLTVIDVCMDSNVVNTTDVLKEVIHQQTNDFAGAMCIDSFAVETLEEAIKVYPGRPMLNSMSMEDVEDGVSKVEAVVKATRDHHPVYIGLAAGGQGPGATREEKADLAKQIVEEAGKFGVNPDQLFIDMNVFPLGSESDPDLNFALESLESIPLIKAIHPDLRTICGIGNLTNGLAKKPYMRKVLTSVWLDEGRKRGLDAAIINPNHYVVVSELDKHDYELAVKAILERDMDAFEDLETISDQKRGGTGVKRTSYEDLDLEEAICRKIVDGFKERENGEVEFKGHTYQYKDKIVLQAAEAIENHDPLTFINDYLMAAMQELGDGFAAGEVSLPHLLKSADVMKQVMGFIEEYMNLSSGKDVHDEIQYKGTIILGTVYQDVHSIGKDLAKTLFENYGYRVIDLGVMTPLQEYIDKAKEYNADAIGMSALLVQTSNHMITVSKMMKEQGLDEMNVLIGGAPVSDRHAAYVAMAGDEDTSDMRKNVFYCPTAMDGVNVMNDLVSTEDGKKDTLIQKNIEKLLGRYERAERRAKEDEELLKSLPKRQIDYDKHKLPESPWFKSEYFQMSVTDFKEHIDKRNLFSLNWKFGGKSQRKKSNISDEHLEALYEEWVEKADKEGYLLPQGVWGVYPCQSDGETVIVYDVDDHTKEIARFDFDLVIGSGKEDTISGAYYYYPVDSGKMDAIGIQISSSGPQIDEFLATFKKDGDSESALYLQGLSDRLAEDIADYLNRKMCERLGYDKPMGTRWSPGYPGITKTAYNEDIMNMLEGDKRLGIQVTEAGEYRPTGTTAALCSFHPDARYQ